MKFTLHSLSFLLYFLSQISGNPQYIIVGLPKSGTTSFQVLFTQNKLRSIHWAVGSLLTGSEMYKAKCKNLPLLHFLQQYDAFTEYNYIGPNICYFPQIEDLDRLYMENKNSTFILTLRNTEKHLKSFKMFYSTDKLMLRRCQHIFDKNPLLSEDDKMRMLIINHVNNVRSYFKDKPEAKFYEYDLDNQNSTVIKLMGFTEPFPHMNKSPNVCHEAKGKA